ncbi:hypothetical protein LDJ79_22310 [Vibrio tritonius]|uniref:Uncharacterized protein n=1 Tax=Vibrio tritonius TaxID=1435069 RepID=A0ABS7YT51_9VIBR|nr:hypothetical protein [Vibrio tritonius]MCA2018863.1 hypothetical protein [Vibrio tritonius]
MTSILINLDEPVFSPVINMSLMQMIRDGNFQWPNGATCVTQESDGELLWWSAPVNEVKAAMKVAKPGVGLIPLIGLGAQINSDYYEIDEQAFVARDWQSEVVTLEQFVSID